MHRDYVDFDLEIVRVGDVYQTSVRDARSVAASAPFVLPFEPTELAEFMLAVGPPRVTSRRLVPAASRVVDVKEYGRRLGDALLAGPVGEAFRSRLGQARSTDRDVCIRLRLAPVPELDPVPWEYLYSAALGRFVTLSTQTPVVRLVDALDAPPAVSVAAPLRVLVMISSPSDMPELAVEREEQLLRATTGDLVKSGQLELVVLEDATLGALQRALLDPFHVFHFIGHGGFDRDAQEGVLVLERDDGTAHRVSGARLGTLLHDARNLQLAVLNACEGARSSGRDAFSGVGQALVRQGLPAVVAMQTEISDRAALVFSHEFYWFLTRGLPIEAVVCEVRKAMAVSDEASEWGTAVLLRSEGSQPFAFAAPSAVAPDREGRWQSLYEAAQGALAADASETARPILEQLAAEQPGYADVTQLLERVSPEAAAPAPQPDPLSSQRESTGRPDASAAPGAVAQPFEQPTGGSPADILAAAQHGGRDHRRNRRRLVAAAVAGVVALVAAVVGVSIWRSQPGASPVGPSGSPSASTSQPGTASRTLPPSGRPTLEPVLPYAFARRLHTASGTRPLEVEGDVSDVLRLNAGNTVVTSWLSGSPRMQLLARDGSPLVDLGTFASHSEASHKGLRFAYVDGSDGGLVVRDWKGARVAQLADPGRGATVVGFADDAVFFTRDGSTWRWQTTSGDLQLWRDDPMVVFNDSRKTAVGTSPSGCFAVAGVDTSTERTVRLDCQGASVIGLTGNATHAIALKHASRAEPERVLLVSIATGVPDVEIRLLPGQVVHAVGYRTAPQPQSVVLHVGSADGDQLYACPVDGACQILTATSPAPAGTGGPTAYVLSRD